MQGFDSYFVLLAGPLLGWGIWALGKFAPRWAVKLLLFLFAGGVVASLVTGSSSPPAVPPTYPSQHAAAPADVVTHHGAADRLVETDGSSGLEERSGPFHGFDKWTAVYDISARTVYLPNGTRLEAHSGLGARLDDPRYVHERMRGATPPNVYELALREKPFHGVRALRLKPMDSSKVFGRTGLLAHTYMLGPKGDSNGCVVFKDYQIFLQAFETGELRRLAVVARLDSVSPQLHAHTSSRSGQAQQQPGISAMASSAASP